MSDFVPWPLSPARIMFSLGNVLVKTDGYPDGTDPTVTAAIVMRGIELACRHPEYATALLRSFEDEEYPNDGLLDAFVREFPLAVVDEPRQKR